MGMFGMRIAARLAFAFATVFTTAAQAQYTGGVVKIGVCTQHVGPLFELAGPGSVAAARLAVQDFDGAAKGIKVEIISGDMQNKADVGVKYWRHPGLMSRRLTSSLICPIRPSLWR